MSNRVWLLVVGVLVPVVFTACATPSDRRPGSNPNTTVGPIVWHHWSNDIFKHAAAEHRFVLLDLEAVWCHWCHVMDDETYSDPTVIGLIGDKYLAVKVDQDARPDLSNRYEDYGWPATVVFDSSGKEIVKRRGYIPPKPMASMLRAIIADPTPGPSVLQKSAEPTASNSISLGKPLHDVLVQRLKDDYDAKAGGWAGDHKFLDPNVVEYCLMYGDADLKHDAFATLDTARKLIDPVWGGVYQYSVGGDWDHPHYEKIMSYQSGDMSIYARAFLTGGDPGALQSAQAIHRYLRDFLTSSQGAFYTSQDADVLDGEQSDAYFRLDDASRRRIGIPRVDKHIYARENGWAIQSLTELYAATDDPKILHEAEIAAKWIIANRALGGGGFRHGEHDAAGPYLGDTLAMGRAFLALYAVTADRDWLARASKCADFISAHFVDHGAGIATSAVKAGRWARPMPQYDENVDAARFAILLFAYDGNPAHRALGDQAMHYLSAPATTASRGWNVGGVLLADSEISAAPAHVTVVGAKSDDNARALFLTAIKLPTAYKRIDWYDPAEGKLPDTDVEYPQLATPAAFLCSNHACSRPLTTPPELRAFLAKVK